MVSGGRPGYDLMCCGQVFGPDGTQVLPAVAPEQKRATEIAWGQGLPDQPSDETLRRVLAGLIRKLGLDPD